MYDILKYKWKEILEKIKTDYEVADVSYKTWIEPLSVDSIKGNTINILYSGEGADIALNLIKHRYYTPLKVTIEEVTGNEYELNFTTVASQNSVPEPSTNISTSSLVEQKQLEAYLNPKYNFDNFIVGSNNNMAHAVALAVAESPCKFHNPLFIYGGPGLGKTHLMHAIGNYIITNNPDLKVLYTSSETFTNELIDIMRSGKKDSTDFVNFRNKYRNVDVLMIDDIQFIIGKDRTQEEFFHTFNDLYIREKQIIITSDKPPKDFTLLEERFRTRFEAGITVDIQSPDYETRMAILKRNAGGEHYTIDDEVFQYIAENILSNVRELEGALNKVIYYGKFTKQNVTLPLAQDVLKDLISPNANLKITSDRIIEIVSEHFNMPISDILSTKRTKEVAYTRQICMYLCKQLTELTYGEIGMALKRQDHSTIIHGVRKITDDIENSPSTKNLIDVLIKKIDPN